MSTTRLMSLAVGLLFSSLAALTAATADPAKYTKPAAAEITALAVQLEQGTKMERIQAAHTLGEFARMEIQAGRRPEELLRITLPALTGMILGYANYQDPLGDACHETLQLLGPDAIIAYAKMLQSDTLKYPGLVAMTNGLTKTLAQTPERTEAVNAALKEVVPMLDNFCRSDLSAYSLWGFSSAMEAIGAPAVPALVAGLKDEKPNIRRLYALMLGNMGAPAREALPLLRGMEADPDQTVKDVARAAISKIEKASLDKK